MNAGNLDTTNLLLGIMAAVSVLEALLLIGVGVLVVLGVYLLLKPADANDEAEAVPRKAQGLLLAVALSVDNLTVGFGLGMLDVPLGLAALRSRAPSSLAPSVPLRRYRDSVAPPRRARARDRQAADRRPGRRRRRARHRAAELRRAGADAPRSQRKRLARCPRQSCRRPPHCRP